MQPKVWTFVQLCFPLPQMMFLWTVMSVLSTVSNVVGNINNNQNNNNNNDNNVNLNAVSTSDTQISANTNSANTISIMLPPPVPLPGRRRQLQLERKIRQDFHQRRWNLDSHLRDLIVS